MVSHEALSRRTIYGCRHEMIPVYVSQFHVLCSLMWSRILSNPLLRTERLASLVRIGLDSNTFLSLATVLSASPDPLILMTIACYALSRQTVLSRVIAFLDRIVKYGHTNLYGKPDVIIVAAVMGFSWRVPQSIGSLLPDGLVFNVPRLGYFAITSRSVIEVFMAPSGTVIREYCVIAFDRGVPLSRHDIITAVHPWSLI